MHFRCGFRIYIFRRVRLSNFYEYNIFLRKFPEGWVCGLSPPPPPPPDLDRPMYLNRHAYLYLLLVNSQYASIICSLSLPRMLILFYHRAVFKKKNFKCYFLKIIVCLWWHKLCEFNFCNTTPFNILIWSHPENL